MATMAMGVCMRGFELQDKGVVHASLHVRRMRMAHCLPGTAMRSPHPTLHQSVGCWPACFMSSCKLQQTYSISQPACPTHSRA